MGYVTGVDLEKLPAIVRYCAEQLQETVGGRMSAWLAKAN
jgi:hypothetical protein